jgi:hypothetical protein
MTHKFIVNMNANIMKGIPKNIVFDKETLYDNVLKIKQYANGLAEDNGRLKAKIGRLQDEVAQKDKMMTEVMQQLGSISKAPGVQRLQREVTHPLAPLDPSHRVPETARQGGRTRSRKHQTRKPRPTPAH